MEKRRALKELEAGRIERGVHTDVIGYERPGRMILAQGSEILHHVTPVHSTERRCVLHICNKNNLLYSLDLFYSRISMVMAFSPANCFQPPKTILESFRRVDKTHNMGDYEFFREKCWQGMYALKSYMGEVKYRYSNEVWFLCFFDSLPVNSNDGVHLAKHLRVVAEELCRASDILDGSVNDMITFFDEVNKRIVMDYAGINEKQPSTNGHANGDANGHTNGHTNGHN